MDQYKVNLIGLTPLLMHQDNLSFQERISAWRNDPANAELGKTKGDDRVPAWTWIGSLYHDGREIGMPSDNLMTMLRDGGAKVRTGKRQETYKKHTQSGIILDQQQFALMVNGNTIPIQPFRDLVGNTDFNAHLDCAEEYGFELLVKRAKIGMSKHVRVRPMFREWTLVGSLTVIDPELSGITQGVLQTVLEQAGSLCGLGDWRPSSPRASGTFGRFQPEIAKV